MWILLSNILLRKRTQSTRSVSKSVKSATSIKLKHCISSIRVHKGLRPFVCDICGKGFGYAHALKKHKLIHAEIKLYRCEYCHKDFRLQHHMKQHELTKLHQNAVRFAKGVNTTYEEEGDDMKGGKQLEEDILYIEEIADDNLIVNSI